jgi:hypothetical protein
MTVAAPSAASRRPIAAPMFCAAPVTIATRPVSGLSMLLVSFSGVHVLSSGTLLRGLTPFNPADDELDYESDSHIVCRVTQLRSNHSRDLRDPRIHGA